MIDWQYNRFDELSAIELFRILKLRQDIFVVEQNCPYHDIDQIDLQAKHLSGGNSAGSPSNHLICYLRIYQQERVTKIGRVVVDSGHRGTGVGSALMEQAISLIKRDYPNNSIALAAQTHLVTFYTRQGFKVNSSEYMEDGIPHVNMVSEF